MPEISDTTRPDGGVGDAGEELDGFGESGEAGDTWLFARSVERDTVLARSPPAE